MTKPAHRQPEHIQREKPPAESIRPESPTSPTGVSARPNDLPEATPELPPLDPATSRKYWIVIILWAAGFGLMIFYEIIAAIWRG